MPRPRCRETDMDEKGARPIEGSGRAHLGEGPLWSERENAVYWVDITGRRLNRLSLVDDVVVSWDMPEPIGWVIERENSPGFIAGLASGFAELTLDPVAIRPIADPEPHLSGNRMNDAKADAQGRIWAGTMPMNARGDSGGLYRLDPDHRFSLVDSPYCIANGPAISPDGQTLFHSDTARRLVYRFALRQDGLLGAREIFLRFDPRWGWPDGMTFDADGGLWIAGWGSGKLYRFTPQGVLDRTITLPVSQVSSCTFAGAALDRMFVSSAAQGVNEPLAGALFEVDPRCYGLPTLRFGG